MKTEAEIRNDKQVKVVLEKASRHHGTVGITITEQAVTVRVTGDRGMHANMVQNGKAWAPAATVRGNGTTAVDFIWEPAYFNGPYIPPTKPEGSLPDADVLKIIPKMQIDTKALLVSICSDLAKAIEAAYPNTGLKETGFGRAKKELLLQVFRALFAEGKISRNVSDPYATVFNNLIYHFQIEVGAKMKLDTELPVARSGSPGSVA